MWRAVLVAWPAAVACGFVAEPLEVGQDDWHGLLEDPSAAGVDRKIQPRMREVMKEVLGTLQGQPVPIGGLRDRYRRSDFTVNSDPKHACIATNNEIVVNNTNSPVLQLGVAKLLPPVGYQIQTGAPLDLTVEHAADVEISVTYNVPMVGDQKLIDQTVRVNVSFSGTIMLLANVSLLEPRIELSDGKQRVAFDFGASVTADSVKWEITGVEPDVDTCHVQLGGASFRACSKVRNMFRYTESESALRNEILPVATERAVSRFRDHLRAIVGPVVAIPITVRAPSVLLA